MTKVEFSQAEEQALAQAGVETYGYNLQQVAAALSEAMLARLQKALGDLRNPGNRSLAAACFEVYMQMKSVSSSGDLQLADRAIIDAQTLLLAAAAKKGAGK